MLLLGIGSGTDSSLRLQGRVAIKWLLLGWVTACGQVNNLAI